MSGNHGSPKPLWLRKGQRTLPEYKEPELTFEEKAEKFHNNGAPKAIKGMTHGAASKLKPAFPEELNPTLELEKALLQPMKTKPDGTQQLSRKRGQDGKFTEAQSSGQQSAAEEDKLRQERQNKTAATRAKEKLVGTETWGKKGMGGGQPLGGNASQSMGTADTSGSLALGMTDKGQTIYDDPYHPEHGSFTPEDHAKASQLHMTMAGSPDPAKALEHRQKASVHNSLAEDSKSPMERVSATMQGANTLKSLNPFDWFFQQNHTGMPNQANAMGAPGAQDPMGGMDPSGMGQPMPPNMGAQPSAGGPPPGMGAPGMPPDQTKPLQGQMGADRMGPKPGMTNTMDPTGAAGIQPLQNWAGTSPELETPMDPYNTTDAPQATLSPSPGMAPPSPTGTPQAPGDFMSQFGGGAQSQIATNVLPQMTGNTDPLQGVNDNGMTPPPGQPGMGQPPAPGMGDPSMGAAPSGMPGEDPTSDPMGEDPMAQEGEDPNALGGEEEEDTTPYHDDIMGYGADDEDDSEFGGDGDGDEGEDPSAPSDEDGDEKSFGDDTSESEPKEPASKDKKPDAFKALAKWLSNQ